MLRAILAMLRSVYDTAMGSTNRHGHNAFIDVPSNLHAAVRLPASDLEAAVRLHALTDVSLISAHSNSTSRLESGYSIPASQIEEAAKLSD